MFQQFTYAFGNIVYNLMVSVHLENGIKIYCLYHIEYLITHLGENAIFPLCFLTPGFLIFGKFSFAKVVDKKYPTFNKTYPQSLKYFKWVEVNFYFHFLRIVFHRLQRRPWSHRKQKPVRCPKEKLQLHPRGYYLQIMQNLPPNRLILIKAKSVPV